MKLSIFMGSPRSTGNTAMLLAPFLDECARLGAETERVELYQRVIQPCLGCMVCQDCMDGPGCVQRDDFDDLFHKMTNSDAVVLATPIYAWYCTPPMKALLDRVIYAGNKNYGREEGLRRFCRHSRAVYLGMLCRRDLGRSVPFLDQEKEQAAREFARMVCRALGEERT